MRLSKAKVTNYRSVKDSGWIDFENSKTILVGPNEAGKTAILRALQQINPPADVAKLDPLRDYPRKDYNDITTSKVDPTSTTVVEAHFELEDEDKNGLGAEFQNAIYVVKRYLDNSFSHSLKNSGERLTINDIKKDLLRLAAHIDSRQTDDSEKSSVKLEKALSKWPNGFYFLVNDVNVAIRTWLESHLALIDEEDSKEEERYDKLIAALDTEANRAKALSFLRSRMPVFVLFSNYYRVKPLIHLDHLATRIEQNLLDDDQYDYGNQCLLKLLGFSARQLSDLGKIAEPRASDSDALQLYRDQKDKRSYQLNAASVKLTDEIVQIWNPNPDRAEANRLRITADGQYLKVVVEDELGVEIELDQRSEGFQWLVSFFVVFFSETQDKHANAILLLDEPGMSLHALKQRDFRRTISKLAEKNQTVYTTHSPFLVGPDELDLVRVVEMNDRREGTKVHKTVTAADPAALLPLQEALGYDLAQSLFSQQRNLILEGLTDYWYLEATASLLRQGAVADLNEKIALIPSGAASKVTYFATILVAHGLKVAALLDSDSAGDQAASQEVLVHKLGAKAILRTKDFIETSVAKPEIEDLLRDTLPSIVNVEFGVDVSEEISGQPQRPIIDILSKKIGKDFSKYKLAKAFLKWSRDHEASDLSESERKSWTKLINTINQVTK